MLQRSRRCMAAAWAWKKALRGVDSILERYSWRSKLRRYERPWRRREEESRTAALPETANLLLRLLEREPGDLRLLVLIVRVRLQRGGIDQHLAPHRFPVAIDVDDVGQCFRGHGILGPEVGPEIIGIHRRRRIFQLL